MTDAKAAVAQAMAEAQAILERDLGDLPAMLAKILRAKFNTGPNAPIVATWCAENPAASARIVGAMAMIQAVRLNAGGGRG